MSLVLAVAVLVAACGDDDATTTTTAATTTTAPAGTTSAPPTTTTTAPTTTTAEPATTTAAPSDGAQITIQGFDFGAPIEVAVGETVTVVNSDAVTHTWTASDGTFDSGRISGGSEFEYSFDAAGEYRFFCDIHPQMSGSITVTG